MIIQDSKAQKLEKRTAFCVVRRMIANLLKNLTQYAARNTQYKNEYLK